MRILPIALLVLALAAAAVSLPGDPQQPAPAQSAVRFEDAAGMIPSNCDFCHGWDARATKTGFYMGSYEGLLDGAFKNGKFQREIIPGDAEHSPLVEYIEGRRKPRMPYERDPLSASQIAAVRRWIDQGAKPDPNTALEHEIALDHVPVEKEKNSFWLSCRTPKDGDAMSLRIKAVDDATGNVVAYTWPDDKAIEKDLKGRWSQWKLTIPPDSMKWPGTVSVRLYYSQFGLGVLGAPTDLDGVIFLLDNTQTPPDQLLAQSDLRAIPEPNSPPNRLVKFTFNLGVRSDVSLSVYPERGQQGIFHWADMAVPAGLAPPVVWNLPPSPSVRTGWYNVRIRCNSRVPGQFQPDLSVGFHLAH